MSELSVFPGGGGSWKNSRAQGAGLAEAPNTVSTVSDRGVFPAGGYANLTDISDNSDICASKLLISCALPLSDFGFIANCKTDKSDNWPVCFSDVQLKRRRSLLAGGRQSHACDTRTDHLRYIAIETMEPVGTRLAATMLAR